MLFIARFYFHLKELMCCYSLHFEIFRFMV